MSFVELLLYDPEHGHDGRLPALQSVWVFGECKRDLLLRLLIKLKWGVGAVFWVLHVVKGSFRGRPCRVQERCALWAENGRSRQRPCCRTRQDRLDGPRPSQRVHRADVVQGGAVAGREQARWGDNKTEKGNRAGKFTFRLWRRRRTKEDSPSSRCDA
jgi:hypothetical protein